MALDYVNNYLTISNARQPETLEAFNRLAENIEAPIPWFAGGIALEPHSMSALLSGILGDDLSWEPDFPTRH
jgi:hypothetical protein